MGKASRNKSLKNTAGTGAVVNAGSKAERPQSDMKPPIFTTLIDRRILHLLLIAVIGLIAYSNTFDVPFVFDDLGVDVGITANPIIRDIDNFFSNTNGYTYNPRRFIGYLTFALNYHFGGLKVAGYHMVNLLIHIINGILVYFFVALTFKTPYLNGEKLKVKGERSQDRSHTAGAGLALPLNNSRFTIHDSRLIALFSGLLFVAHPVQTQAVTYIIQRFASLATLFYLASLVFYIKGRLASTQAGKPASFFLSVIFAVFALRTKEITFTLPLAIALYEFIFFGYSLKKILLFLLPITLTLIIMLVSIIGIHGSPGEMLSGLSEKTRLLTDMSRSDYLLTQLRVITTYIRLIFLPVNQTLDYDYPIYRSLFTPQVFLSFLFLSALFGTAVYLLYKSREAGKLPEGGEGSNQPSAVSSRQAGDRSRFTIHDSRVVDYSLFTIHYSRLIGFGILWFFITLSVESSIIPIVDVMYEHRVYLPSVGAFIAIITALFVFATRVSLKFPQANKIIIASLALIIVILTGATYSRNMVWKNPVSLWEDVIRKSPNKARGYNNLCNAYYRAKQIDEAIDTCGKALAINPKYADAYYNIGSALIQKKQFADAIEACNKAIALDPKYAPAYDKLGIAYAGLNQIDRAIAEFNKAIAIDNNYVFAYNDLGIAYARVNQIDRAIMQFSKAISVDHNYPDAYKNRGIAYFQTGNIRDAVPDLQRSCDMGDSVGCEYLKRAFNKPDP